MNYENSQDKGFGIGQLIVEKELRRWATLTWLVWQVTLDLDSSFLVVLGDTFRVGVVFCFQEEKEGQSALIAPTVSHLPLFQNNQHANVTYFGMACFGFLKKHARRLRRIILAFERSLRDV